LRGLVGLFLFFIFLSIPFKITDVIPKWAGQSNFDKVAAVAVCLFLGAGEAFLGYALWDGLVVGSEIVRTSPYIYETVEIKESYPVLAIMAYVGACYLIVVGGLRAATASTPTQEVDPPDLRYCR